MYITRCCGGRDDAPPRDGFRKRYKNSRRTAAGVLNYYYYYNRYGPGNILRTGVVCVYIRGARCLLPSSSISIADIRTTTRVSTFASAPKNAARRTIIDRVGHVSSIFSIERGARQASNTYKKYSRYVDAIAIPWAGT